jgi:hypothetical protein
LKPERGEDLYVPEKAQTAGEGKTRNSAKKEQGKKLECQIIK